MKSMPISSKLNDYNWTLDTGHLLHVSYSGIIEFLQLFKFRKCPLAGQRRILRSKCVNTITPEAFHATILS